MTAAEFRNDLESIAFLLGLGLVVFGADALDAARAWWRRRRAEAKR